MKSGRKGCDSSSDMRGCGSYRNRDRGRKISDILIVGAVFSLERSEQEQQAKNKISSVDPAQDNEENRIRIKRSEIFLSLHSLFCPCT